LSIFETNYKLLPVQPATTVTMGMISAVFLILITLIFPPAGVAIVAGCGADLLINICLTILGGIPGHIHAFYIEYVYYKRREDARHGIISTHAASGVYSDRVQNAGRNYGTISAPPAPPPPGQYV